MRDGLSSRQVYDIEEDADGFIWIYTNSGLERYDGYRFRHYSLDDSEESNDHIASATTMQLASDGQLRVATKSGSIYRYDKVSDRFIRCIKFSDPSVRIYHFAAMPDNHLLVATSKGVFGCSGSEAEKIALDGIFVSAVLPDSGGVFYAGTEKGVYRIDSTRGGQATLMPGTEDIYVKSLAKASGRLYVGPFASDVFAIDLTDGRKHLLPFKIPPIPVNAMTPMDNDRLLIGVDGAGVYMVDSRDGHLLRHYRDGDGSACELSGSTVTDVLVDHAGGLWISTTHSGVNYIPPYAGSLHVMRSAHGNPQSLPSSHVNVVFEDSYGERWFGTDKGVSRFNPANGKWNHYLQNHDYSANVILSIDEDSHGDIWVGSYGEGAACINRATNAVTHLPVRVPGSDRGVDTRYLFTSHCDSDGNVWFGGINGLTTRYNIGSDSYAYYDEDCISLVTDGQDGTLILGGNRGVGIYDKSGDSLHWMADFDSISIHYPVRSLLADTVSSELWIGTMGEGLIRYDVRNNTVRRYTTADGMSSNTVYTILRDKVGATWICTENDIYRYNPETERLRRFTYYVQPYSFATEPVSFNPGGVVTADGDVLLASHDGCIVFNPSRDFKPMRNSPLMLTNFQLNDRTVIPGEPRSPLRTNIDIADRLVLDHSDNNIAIDFAVINIPAPQRIDYEYMLEGFDDGFRKSDASCRARYTALPPGHYTFRVRAIDLYDDTVKAERELPIVIRSPWWQTWWARLSCLIAIAAILILAVGYLRNRRREHRIETQIRTFANIAHDIRTPMSMIKAPLINVEQEGSLSEQGRRNLALARSGIDKTLSLLTAMLDIPGGALRHDELYIESCDIREFLKVKCEEFAPLAMLNGLTLTSEVSEDMPHLVGLDYDKLGHVIDNLLSNAIKYTREGSVTISAKLEGKKQWCLGVRDTGIGIPRRDRRRIFNYRHRGSEAIERNIPGTGMGLLITRRLVRLHKGRISFESEEGTGTEFKVTLPLIPMDSVNDTYSYPSGGEETGAIPEVKAGKNRVFVIDDDEDMRSFLSEAFGGEYEVTLFSESSELLERLRRDTPDMVIADVMMPKIRGDELCRIIKTDITTSHIPVILLSGLTAREDVINGLESHADDYIVKPFDIIVLKARMRNIIKNRRQLSRQVLDQDSKPEDAEYTSELDRRFMTTVMEQLNASLANPEFSVGDLCARLGMSRTSVYNKIRSITGQSVNEFIRIVRLNKSKELLSTGLHNVSEVAYMVGFSDPKYFSTCFKKQFGISPSKFSVPG